MGELFGPYRLEELLGRGGMGEVHRAVDTSKGRTVAVKRLNPALAADQSFQERFRREARLTARLDSPHVIPIHDYGAIGDWLFIDMRLAKGNNLGELLAREGPLPVARAVEIVAQVADALDAAHQENMVHRDVKPSNVMVSSHRGRDFVYLVDFGIVRALDASTQTSLTTTGSAIGTLAYMAPELFTDATPDHRADIYALGCLLYQTLTARPPFNHEGPALMYAHLKTPPPRPSALRPDLPRSLDEVVARAMHKDPEHRPPSAGQLADAATAAISTPSAARPEPLSPAGSAVARSAAPSTVHRYPSGPPRALPGGFPPPSVLPSTAPPAPTTSPVRTGSRFTPARTALVFLSVVALLAVALTLTFTINPSGAGAIAYSPVARVGSFGFGPDQQTAESDALRRCNNMPGTQQSCRGVESFTNRWGALATANDGSYGYGYAWTKSSAEEYAVNNCKDKGAAGCSVILVDSTTNH